MSESETKTPLAQAAFSAAPTCQREAPAEAAEEGRAPRGRFVLGTASYVSERTMKARERLVVYLNTVPENERGSARIRLRTAFAFMAEALAGHEVPNLDTRHDVNLQEILRALGVLDKLEGDAGMVQVFPRDLPPELTRDEEDLLDAAKRAGKDGVSLGAGGMRTGRMLAARNLVTLTGGVVTLGGAPPRKRAARAGAGR